jgi:hypothetical protein
MSTSEAGIVRRVLNILEPCPKESVDLHAIMDVLNADGGPTFSCNTVSESLAECKDIVMEPGTQSARVCGMRLLSLPAKVVNRWIPSELVVEIAPGRECAPCGPYFLQPIDTGELGFRYPVSMRLNTTFLRDVWIEHRTLASNGSALQVMSARFTPLDYYGMGAMKRRVVADMLHNTMQEATDWGVRPGETMRIDLGPQGQPLVYELAVVGVDAGNRLELVVWSQGALLASPPLPCSQMYSHLTNLRKTGEWCESPERNNPQDCPQFYAAKLDWDLPRRCAFVTEGVHAGKCRLAGHECVPKSLEVCYE